MTEMDPNALDIQKLKKKFFNSYSFNHHEYPWKDYSRALIAFFPHCIYMEKINFFENGEYYYTAGKRRMKELLHHTIDIETLEKVNGIL